MVTSSGSSENHLMVPQRSVHACRHVGKHSEKMQCGNVLSKGALLVGGHIKRQQLANFLW